MSHSPRGPEPQLTRLFDLLADAVGIHYAGRLVTLNPPCLALFGYTTGDELLGQSLLALISPEERPRITDYVKRRAGGDPPPSSYVTVGMRRDGSLFDLEVAISPLDVDGQAYSIVRMRDVTREQATARALREGEEIFRLVADQSLVGIYMMQDDRLVFANGGVASITGFSVQEMTGWTAIDFSRMVHPDDLDFAREQARRKQGGEGGQTEQYSYRVVSRCGAVRHVDQFSRTIPYRGRPASLGFILDVTARREAEEQRTKLEAQLWQAQKMEAVGRLAGGVAHDFNNLLTVITGNVDALNGVAGAEPRVTEYLLEIGDAARRAAALTSQLLLFSRKKTLVLRPVQLDETVARLEGMLARLLREDVHFATKLQRVSAIHADLGQVEQCIVNLVVNANAATAPGGRIEIALAEEPISEADPRRPPSIGPGPFVELSVSDTGHGIPPELMKQIFEPFFTTRGPGEGTGLGLAMVDGFMAQLGGFISVRSSVGGGSTFTLHFPRAPAHADAPHPEAARVVATPDTRLERPATVLLVEDEPAVRRVTARALLRAGFEVLEADDGIHALEIAAGAGRVDAVVTDVVMPRMGGRELVERLSKLRPGIRALFVSGYTRDSVLDDIVATGSVAFLQKPFVAAALVAALRQALESREDG